MTLISSSDLKISDQQFDWMVDRLKDFVAIPSISNPHAVGYDMLHLVKASAFAHALLEEIGFEARSVSIEGSAPFIIGKRHVAADKPTIIVYAHYDVQPVDATKWNSNPFEMVEKEGRYYGRGASDDKAGVLAACAAFKAYREADLELPVNVTVLFEGEEEYGSGHMEALLKQEAKALHGHALIILDGMNRSVDTGTLTSSNRGIVNLTVEINALRQPVHSGQGLLAPDPAQALADLITRLKNPREIPGMMEDATLLSDEEGLVLRQNSLTSLEFAKEKGVLEGCKLRGSEAYSVYERLVEEPNISILNITCGQPHGGNSIQDKASCIVSIRTLAGQNPEKVAQSVMGYLKKQPILWNLPMAVTQQKKGDFAWKGDPSRPFSQHYLKALQAAFPNTCVRPSGGTLPLLHEFETAFPDIEVLVPGVEDPSTNAHSHNESQDKALLRNATDALIAFLRKASEIRV